MPNSNKHAHLKGLIDLFANKPLEEVELIVFRPIDPPEPAGKDPKTGKDAKFDRIAYVFGKGSDYAGKFKHLDSCTWVE